MSWDIGDARAQGLSYIAQLDVGDWRPNGKACLSCIKACLSCMPHASTQLRILVFGLWEYGFVLALHIVSVLHIASFCKRPPVASLCEAKPWQLVGIRSRPRCSVGLLGRLRRTLLRVRG